MEEAKNQYRTNYVIKITGWLGHDNKLFNMTCRQCGGMYSSFNTAACQKCGQVLVPITTKDGKNMSISEGTLYPSFGPKQKERDAEAIRNRKKGMEATYRFKMFAFSEPGVVTMPSLHSSMIKGVMIELIIINHQLIPSWYQTKDKVVKVELMAMIYPKYGDTIKVLKQPEVADATVAFPVNVDGSPANIPEPYPQEQSQTVQSETDKKIAAIEQILIELKGGSPIPTAKVMTASIEEEPADTCIDMGDTPMDTSVDPFFDV